MKNLDPNVRWATHSVLITYQQWDYKLGVVVKLGESNVRGFGILEHALSFHAEQLYKDQGDHPKLILTRPALDGSGEDTLEVELEDEDMDNWLQSMCVGLDLIEIRDVKLDEQEASIDDAKCDAEIHW